MWSWLLHVLGVEPRTPSTAYNWWSGAGSDLSELALVGALLGAARAHNCHVKGCWRLGKHQVADGTYKVCTRHHPTVPDRVTAALVADAHTQSRVGGPKEKRRDN